MQTIEALLHARSSIASIDAEVLLSHILKVDRSYLYAYPERLLSDEETVQFSDLLQKRLQGVPVAYLTGRREFWSLDLMVTTDTLIPRPETELLVETLLQLPQKQSMTIADLGTGCGAIACAIAKERPDWIVYATDMSAAALNVAKANANEHGFESIHFTLGDWCDALPPIFFDIIVSNPPYIAKDDAHLECDVLRYEPHEALIADDEGLRAIQHIISSAYHSLKPGGYLLIEHGFAQGADVRHLFGQANYSAIKTYTDLSGLERVTLGCRI